MRNRLRLVEQFQARAEDGRVVTVSVYHNQVDAPAEGGEPTVLGEPLLRTADGREVTRVSDTEFTLEDGTRLTRV